MAQTPNFPVLETSRLILREIVPTDAGAIFAIHGDPDLMKWFGVDPLVNIEAAQKLIETFASWRLLPTPGTRWGIQLKNGGPLIGSCGLFQWNAMWRKCVVGYELARGAHGYGFATEALSACFNWAFSTTQLHRIEAQVHPENYPSIKLLEKVGFVKEGMLREVGYWGGKRHSMFQYGMLRGELCNIAASR
jgi:ribosomal-protein-alanine N-acetyltransferase